VFAHAVTLLDGEHVPHGRQATAPPPAAFQGRTA
jgi:hypothetical protein